MRIVTSRATFDARGARPSRRPVPVWQDRLVVAGERNVASRNGPPVRVSTGRRPNALARLGLTGSVGRGDARPRWAGGPATSRPPAPSRSCGRWPAAPTPTSRCARWSGCSRAAARPWRSCDAALRRDVVLRGRLLALLGGSTALGDHLVAHPDRWRRLTADARRPITDVATGTLLTAVGADPAAPPAGSRGGWRRPR